MARLPNDVGFQPEDVPLAPPEVQESLNEEVKVKKSGKYEVKNTFIFVPQRHPSLGKLTLADGSELPQSALKSGEVLTLAQYADCGVTEEEVKRFIETGAIELLKGTD